MTIILQVLVVAVFVGLSVDGLVRVQPYKQNVKALKDAAKALATNVLSMEGHIPPLNDTRRHYAEIFHVVNYHGRQKSIYSDWPYTDVYYSDLEKLAPQAIDSPEMVIAEVKYLLDEVHKKTNEINDLINACHDTPAVCNELIDNTVNENQDQYGVQDIILSDAARAARVFNEMNVKFEEISNDLRAHQYVCSSPDQLWILVVEVANLYRTLDLQSRHK